MRKIYPESDPEPSQLEIPVLLSAPGAASSLARTAVLDTGAMMSVVSPNLRTTLKLPEVFREQEFFLADGRPVKAEVVECTITCPNVGTFILRAAVLGNELILGMNWFNQVRTCYGYSAPDQGWVLEISP